jgi:hypothetical protein
LFRPTGLGGENSEAVVPEAASDDEARVDGCHEAVAANLDFLTEIIAKMSSHLLGAATAAATTAASTATSLF